MHKLQVFVDYAAPEPRLGLIRNPLYLNQILHHPQQIRLLTAPLPSTEAFIQLHLWQSRFRGKLRFFWKKIPQFESAKVLPLQPVQDQLSEVLDPILALLQGRILSESLILKIMRQQGYWPSLVSAALDFGAYHGVINQYPGFQSGPWHRLICTRCQSEQIALRPCLNCGSQECTYCLNCESLGGNRGCSIYFTTVSEIFLPLPRETTLNLDFTLTQAQHEASLELLHFWKTDQAKALVWAACGAGKTEVTFALIQQALSEGHKVLFAIPRTDIVREMAKRLEDAFPNTEIAPHYAGQPLIVDGQLVVATTHQVIHFYQRFPLVILDEVDAFPYDGNELLRFALIRSLSTGGKMVEMTATPKNLKNYDQVVTIPARYHGYPLPEPRLVVEALPPWEELTTELLPEILSEKLLNQNQNWLIFAPTILACTKIAEVLAVIYPGQVGLCHSQDPQRVRTIERFRQGELRIVVTTSVLERGVNFPGVHVFVVYGEHGVFSTSALVQIAGRVGRSEKWPRGEVIFLASRKTVNITKSLELISQLNQEAASRGLLQDEISS